MVVSSLAKCVCALIVLAVLPASAQDATRLRLITASPSAIGQPLTLTAEVDSLGGDRPTGLVTFADGATALGSASLSVLGAGQETLAAAESSTCVISSNGGVQCWGYGFDKTAQEIIAPAAGVVSLGSCAVTSIGGCFSRVSGSSGAGDIVAAAGCVLTTAGVVKCAGGNRAADDSGSCCGDSKTLGVVASRSTYKAIVSSSLHKCALTTAGGVECWGWGGLIGDGTTQHRIDPTPVVGLSSGVVALTAGFRHTCAVTVTGALKCWGVNLYGAIGDGTKWNTRLAPVQVSGLTSNVVAASAGTYHTCALLGSGAVRCWGFNQSGQLGDGTTADQLTPSTVLSLEGVAVAISAGGSHSCAVLAGSRAVRCWGANSSGQIGDGTTTQRLFPRTATGVSAMLRTRARLTTSALGAGWHFLHASYAGDAGHTGASDIVPQGVQ